MKKFIFIKKTMIQATFVAFIVLVASCGFNQKSRDTKNVAEEQNEARFDNSEQENDAQFLVNAAENNLKQIQLGQLAQQKGRTTHVKELGKRMEDAHTKSQRDLTALARSKMITIPTSPTNDVQDAYNDLNDKSENDFDKAYADKMVSKHKDAIETFEDASEDSNDNDIRNWATASLPELRTHLDHSIECQRKCEDMKRNQNVNNLRR